MPERPAPKNAGFSFLRRTTRPTIVFYSKVIQHINLDLNTLKTLILALKLF